MVDFTDKNFLFYSRYTYLNKTILFHVCNSQICEGIHFMNLVNNFSSIIHEMFCIVFNFHMICFVYFIASYSVLYYVVAKKLNIKLLTFNLKRLRPGSIAV